ncbi:hypothetical protein NX059_009289 [Plenodomus lindquistii]|nr:hypothetical protein NX059_009289 [Plenodomus lindquistii]
MMVPSSSSFSRVCILSCMLSLLHGVLAYVGGATVSSTILVIARDSTSAVNSAGLGLQGYGIPYQVLTVPQTGVTSLPALNSTATQGNFGGIVVIGDVTYDYNGLYNSALTSAQWSELYAYQTRFGARMVRLDVFPAAEFGVLALGGNTNDEPLTFTNTTAFPTANLKTDVGISTAGFWHTPATITNGSLAVEVAKFGTAGTAAVINQIGDRQQMAWFLPFALDWSASSNIAQHAWITWVTRGLYVGFRRIYLSAQVDDMFLETELYRPQGQKYRATPADMTAHVRWQSTLNAKLPAGSEFYLEIGHNGNGDIEAGVYTTAGQTSCNPPDAIYYPEQPEVNKEYKKVPGVGDNIWPATPANYSWSLACASIDPLMQWFYVASQRDAFAHISHTFSHADLTNATFSDTSKEIQFNKAWLTQIGLSAAKRFSPKGIIPPAITGLYNADAIRAWMTNGIVNVVGDNTRPGLRNSQNTFWPYITTVDTNGYAGLTVMPRWATLIYYNCDSPDCTLQEWIDTSAGSGNFDSLLANTRESTLRNLMGLHWDPYMFHQANMRVAGIPATTVNGVSGQYSLLMTWLEVITTAMTTYTTWPMRTLKQDDIVQQFVNRQTRDQCSPSMTWKLSTNGASIESVNVFTAGGNRCGTTIPITLPGAVTSTAGATKEQLGTDPLTLWVNMAGASRSYRLSSPLRL